MSKTNTSIAYDSVASNAYGSLHSQVLSLCKINLIGCIRHVAISSGSSFI